MTIAINPGLAHMRSIPKALGALLVAILFLAVSIAIERLANRITRLEHTEDSLAALAREAPFQYQWNSTQFISETGTPEESASPYFWLNSGGTLYLAGGIGSTIHGALPERSYWRTEYRATNPEDTENGRNPQNVFRLLTVAEWKNVEQEAYFRIDAYNVSRSTNQNESNGIFLMSRYQNADNLFYAGVRVDGAATIKRKLNGNYETLAYRPYLPGSPETYRIHQSLLPQQTWFGIRSTVSTDAQGRISIALFIDRDDQNHWEQLVETTDRISTGNAPLLFEPGRAGIRSDFMDLEIKDYRTREMP